ncbi:MAG: hypothetical protein A2312_03380 [Candidatus Staskawiczbacteria bacterium RIFOXYB2_FULL_32_9]|uniref:L-asparaginase N-terminal domain-containing protein n=1 Tax=Candidatus Staskawiczbacteria bacterium RIFOXYD1_FULL_32_13 TaxID=1802234 RepID=A0A1G2JLV0_9BACT|nr:MAG: Asparaginase [Parcubacteria group bacterium GW2011_GWC2_32_10]OGZ79538.1 MAG: hypothetical protein A2360_04710 [Candidatus Staskawiczbacteria bacterium RIFOXYB1_FULL_32_11]OGZ80862.1 MAG: hypothetical protein A2256_00060 [Candidatus Staskawiczbacteria bacterium RIFOXYA2_FULL_32_7]OGZ83948.1 MAG: hypothetical protein A2312_03380 [Candidatus Staskawiczbacteria bacterium RIFOXYB2_FULL_32_9]OGZ86092.1 MAG: hypothetical protein A2463_01255 [Candidatus Staskawiczbacteria bacterium RIFOXYC2_FU
MKIKIFTCGGTIDKIYAEKKGVYNFSFGEPAILSLTNSKVRLNFDYSVDSLLEKDSLDMDDNDRQIVKKACENAQEKKILITHGTDTMIDTARTLSSITDKVIVLTGASQPWRFRESDAEFNIGVAIGVLNVKENGIYVAMNGSVFIWDKCQKLEDGRFVEK